MAKPARQSIVRLSELTIHFLEIDCFHGLYKHRNICLVGANCRADFATGHEFFSPVLGSPSLKLTRIRHKGGQVQIGLCPF